MPFPAAAHARDLLAATMGRGHGERGLRGDDRGRRGARRPASVSAVVDARRIGYRSAKKPSHLQGIWDFRPDFVSLTAPAAPSRRAARQGRSSQQSSLSSRSLPMPIAFKEWAVTVRALAEGEQLITLRKGGIREPEQALPARPRALLPVPHLRPPAGRPRARVPPARAAPRARGGRLERRRAAAARVRLRRAASSSPTACASAPGPKSPATSRSSTRAAWTRSRPFYVWTPDYAEKRLGWRGRQPLHVLLLRTYRIPRPVTVKVKDEYTGSRRLGRAAARTSLRGHPRALRRRVRARLRRDPRDHARSGAGQPVLV